MKNIDFQNCVGDMANSYLQLKAGYLMFTTEDEQGLSTEKHVKKMKHAVLMSRLYECVGIGMEKFIMVYEADRKVNGQSYIVNGFMLDDIYTDVINFVSKVDMVKVATNPDELGPLLDMAKGVEAFGLSVLQMQPDHMKVPPITHH